jgi:hypothetical protein
MIPFTALVSASGAPGCSTVGVAVTGAAGAIGVPLLLVDADASGGQVAPLAGLDWSPNTADLAAETWEPLTEARLSSHSQRLGPLARVVVGPPTGPQAASALAVIGPELARLLAQGGPVVVDAGRITAGCMPPLVAAAQLAVVVVGQVAGSRWATGGRVAKAAALAAGLADAGLATAAVVVGDDPYPDRAELAEVLATPVLAVVPWDPAGALGIGEAARRGQLRSPLMRAARELIEALDCFVADRTASPTRTAPGDEVAV